MNLRLTLRFRFCLSSSRLARQRSSSDLKLSTWQEEIWSFEGAGVVELTFWSQPEGECGERHWSWSWNIWRGILREESVVELMLQGAKGGESQLKVLKGNEKWWEGKGWKKYRKEGWQWHRWRILPVLWRREGVTPGGVGVARWQGGMGKVEFSKMWYEMKTFFKWGKFWKEI